MFRIRYYKKREKGQVTTPKIYHASSIDKVHEWVANNVSINETGVMAVFEGKELLNVYAPIGGILTIADSRSFSDNPEYPWKLYRYKGKNTLGDKLSFVRSFPNFEDISVWLNLERSYDRQICKEIFSVYNNRQFVAEMRCERYFRPIFPSV